MTIAVIRSLESRDIDAILQIQSASPEAAQWSRAAYENLGGVGHAWVAELDDGIIGFLIARVMPEEMEILNLAVAPNARRQGLGAVLLQEALSQAAQRGAVRVFLEVRASNAVAQRFYETHGFVSASKRPHYYNDPVEDALILTRILDHK